MLTNTKYEHCLPLSIIIAFFSNFRFSRGLVSSWRSPIAFSWGMPSMETPFIPRILSPERKHSPGCLNKWTSFCYQSLKYVLWSWTALKKNLNYFVRTPKKKQLIKLWYASEQISIKQFQYFPQEKAAIASRKKPSDSCKSVVMVCVVYTGIKMSNIPLRGEPHWPLLTSPAFAAMPPGVTSLMNKAGGGRVLSLAINNPNPPFPARSRNTSFISCDRMVK